MSFNPRQYVIQIKSKEGSKLYLPVIARIGWFRDTYPDGRIITDIIGNAPYLIAHTTIHGSDGAVLATGMATLRAGEGQRWEGREIEKAETASIGRALQHAGFALEFIDRPALVIPQQTGKPDTPVEPKPKVEPGKSQTNAKRPPDIRDHADLNKALMFLMPNDFERQRSLVKHVPGGEEPLFKQDDTIDTAIAMFVLYKVGQKLVLDSNMSAEFVKKALDCTYNQWLKEGKSHEMAWEIIQEAMQLEIDRRIGEISPEIDVAF